MKYIGIITVVFCLASCGGNSQDGTTDGQDTLKHTGDEKLETAMKLLKKNTCLTCHKVSESSIGPSFQDISAKNYNREQIMGFIYEPVPSNWPDYPPMLPLRNVPPEEAGQIADWIISLNKK